MKLSIMKKQRSILMSAFLITVFFVASSTYGQTNNILVVYTEWFPYTYQEKAETLGFEIEILKAVMANMNIDTKFEQYPWNRCLHSLKNGKADVLVSLLKTPEREKFTFYPDNHISISKTVLFTTAGSNIKFDGSYEKLKGYSIGVISGFSYGDAFDKAEYLTKDTVKNAELLIGKLLHGRNDLGAENQAVIRAYAHKMKVQDRIRFLKPPIHTQKLYVGFSKMKGLKKMSENFSIALGKFKNSEAYKKILRKYGIKYAEMAE